MTDSVLVSKFVQARNYTPGPRDVAIDLIVIHDMETPELMTEAEDVANYFANQAPSSATGSSANYNVDNDSIVCCVHEDDIAWHAPHANHNGIGIEHAGRASQRAQDWADPYSEAELHLSARLSADICRRRNIPVQFVDAAGLKRAERGITTHWEVTKAFGPVGGHTDPGPNFPMAHYIDLVRVGGGAPKPQPKPQPKEIPEMLIRASGGETPIYATDLLRKRHVKSGTLTEAAIKAGVPLVVVSQSDVDEIPDA